MKLNIFSVIFMNFWGFDIFIFLTAIFNGVVFYMVKLSADRLRGRMTHKIFVPHFNLSRRESDKQAAELREEDVLELRASMDRFYALFVNLTGIFPLLGILGTVVSLLGLVSDMENVTGNFYGALTSTFWGLIFAILFKFLDGVISPEIESNEKNVRIYLDSKTAEETGAAAETLNEAASRPVPEVTVVPAQEESVSEAAEPEIVQPVTVQSEVITPESGGEEVGDEE